MAIKLLIPTALRAFTDGQKEVSVDGDTVGKSIAAFAEAYPDIRRHLYDDEGGLREYINLYVGETNAKNLDGLDTAVKDGDTITLVPAIAGGSGK